MTTVSAARPAVHPIPADSDGTLHPELIAVAAYLCTEDYPDDARSRILARLADGVAPRVCCLQGVLEWPDLAEVERLSGRRPAAPARSADGSIAEDPDPELTRWLAEPVRTPGVPLPSDLADGPPIPRPDTFGLDWTPAELEVIERRLERRLRDFAEWCSI